MIDNQHLPTSGSTQIFYTNGSTSWQTWQKPPNAKIVSFFVIGGGGGGGSGSATGIDAAKSGGGGGGSSAYAYATFPAFLIPDIVYLQVGHGGAGGAAGNVTLAGATGSISYVSASQGTAITDLILASGTLPANGGVGAITAGAGGTIFVSTNSIISQAGLLSSAAGIIGGAGAGPGTSITPTVILSPGAGGASYQTSTAYAGGSINSFGFFLGLSGGSAGGSTTNTAPGGDGPDGVSYIGNADYPFFCTGGAGGGSSNRNKGGKGGNGGYGCGGGGGGGGLTGATAGNGGGGDGGDGLIIITSY